MDEYDAEIIASGVIGSTIGAILARNGVKVLSTGAGAHPKFAVGESMILETSDTLRALAQFVDVPEAEEYRSETVLTHIGATHGVKRHFSFVNHTPDAVHDVAIALQAAIPRIHSPEQEFQDFIDRYPSMQQQFKTARGVRSWTRTDHP